MFDFKDFLSTHLEHINLAILIVMIILIIVSMATGSAISGSLQLVLALVGVAANVAHRYPQLLKFPGSSSGEEQSTLIV